MEILKGPTPPKTAVVLVNWNGLEDTRECLTSLSKSDYANTQVIVVDNGSVDQKVQELPAEFPNVTVLSMGYNSGYAHATNEGAKFAISQMDANYVFFLNNDTIVAKDTITKLVDTCEADGTIGIAGAVNYRYSDPTRICFSCGKVDWRRGNLGQ